MDLPHPVSTIIGCLIQRALSAIAGDCIVVGPGLQSRQVGRPVMDRKAHYSSVLSALQHYLSPLYNHTLPAYWGTTQISVQIPNVY